MNRPFNLQFPHQGLVVHRPHKPLGAATFDHHAYITARDIYSFVSTNVTSSQPTVRGHGLQPSKLGIFVFLMVAMLLVATVALILYGRRHRCSGRNGVCGICLAQYLQNDLERGSSREMKNNPTKQD